MPKHMPLVCGIAASLALALPSAADVTLRSKDGTFVIEGELSQFVDGVYRVVTSIGPFDIDAGLVECEGAACPELEPMDLNLRIVVTGGFDPQMMPDVIKAYLGGRALTYSDAGTTGAYRVTVSGETGRNMGDMQVVTASAQTAFEMMRTGEADMVLTGRRVTNDEVDAFADQGINILATESETILGNDAVVLAVSPENPVRSLTLTEAEGLFSGLVTNWSEVGGADQPVNLFAPVDGDAVADTFRSLVLDPVFSDYSFEAERALGGADLVRAVAGQQGAIGLTRLSELQGAKPVSLVDACGIEVEANRFSLLSENYPLTQRLYAYKRADSGIARALGQFMASDSGQELLETYRYVGTAPEVFDLSVFGRQFVYGMTDPSSTPELENLRNFGREILTAERLSTTFRFAPGSSQLDNKARADARRLVELLQRPEYQKSEVLLVGFTDAIGASDVNKLLSQRRAEQVLTELQTLGGAELQNVGVATFGFGESFAVACNEEEAGRNLNRRVEVWLR